jgi:hypothetical protein
MRLTIPAMPVPSSRRLEGSGAATMANVPAAASPVPKPAPNADIASPPDPLVVENANSFTTVDCAFHLELAPAQSVRSEKVAAPPVVAVKHEGRGGAVKGLLALRKDVVRLKVIPSQLTMKLLKVDVVLSKANVPDIGSGAPAVFVKLIT